jgi:predicted nucleotidyltransferase
MVQLGLQKLGFDVRLSGDGCWRMGDLAGADLFQEGVVGVGFGLDAVQGGPDAEEVVGHLGGAGLFGFGAGLEGREAVAEGVEPGEVGTERHRGPLYAFRVNYIVGGGALEVLRRKGDLSGPVSFGIVPPGLSWFAGIIWAEGRDEGSAMRARIPVDRRAIAEFCRRNRIRRLSLFGSVLRDDFGPESDVDVLVEFEPGARVGFIGLAGMESELSDVLGRRADIRTPNDLSRYFRQEVLAAAEEQYAAA